VSFKVAVRYRQAVKHPHMVHPASISLISGLAFHRLDVFLSRQLLITHSQREVLGLDALKKLTVAPRLRWTILAIDLANLGVVSSSRILIYRKDRPVWKRLLNWVPWSNQICEYQTKAKSNEGNKQTNEKLVHVQTSGRIA
jgi:hypothetical protein